MLPRNTNIDLQLPPQCGQFAISDDITTAVHTFGIDWTRRPVFRICGGWRLGGLQWLVQQVTRCCLHLAIGNLRPPKLLHVRIILDV